MSIVSGSLAGTIDATDDALQQGMDLTPEDRAAVAAFLLEREVAAGRNAGAFAPTAADLSGGVRLYTGEPLRTKLATWNVLTAEAARLLVLLREPEGACPGAVERAAKWLAVSCFGARDCVVGECAHSFAAHLRFLSAAGAEASVVVRAVNVLNDHRDGNGRWHRFPFYYTLLTLTEIQAEPARLELRYAIRACERVRGRRGSDEVYGERRAGVIDRVLALADLRLL